MKQTTCSAMGGPGDCSEVISGASAEEMIGAGWNHIQEAHPDLAENIQNNPKEVNDAWMKNFKDTFDSLEDAS